MVSVPLSTMEAKVNHTESYTQQNNNVINILLGSLQMQLVTCRAETGGKYRNRISDMPYPNRNRLPEAIVYVCDK